MYFLGIALFFTLFFALFFITVRHYDPLKIWHINKNYSQYLQINMRQQAAGIINNYDFDSAILGTSMLVNTSAKEANEILGGRFFNISMQASNFYERSFVLQYAIDKKKLKKVLYSLDTYSIINSDISNNKGLKECVYDKNPLNDFEIYLNDRYIMCLFTFMKIKGCKGEKADFDRPNKWCDNVLYQNRFGGIDNWLKNKNKNQIRATFEDVLDAIKEIKANNTEYDKDVDKKMKNSKKYIDDYIVKFVKESPKTEFLMFIPPYSRIENSILVRYKKSDYKILYDGLKYLVEISSKYPNLKIYAWGDMDFVDDIANYMDLTHYSPKINSKMLLWIKEDKGLLTLENFDKYWETFTKKSMEFDIFSIGEKIESYLK
ncbi:hypothetical protein [uncultured Campylobacter sp.]|uniref:hypothetical protein n=1 Tax=uncultured Campylobacter sp. TaxID=218934 RepID=UPI002615ADAE|nr:hypothetical protein [uncultured Campylobacter sp.]